MSSKESRTRALLENFYQVLIKHSPRISRKKMRSSKNNLSDRSSTAKNKTSNTGNNNSRERPFNQEGLFYQYPDIVVEDYENFQSRHYHHTGAKIRNSHIIRIQRLGYEITCQEKSEAANCHENAQVEQTNVEERPRASKQTPTSYSWPIASISLCSSDPKPLSLG